MSLYSQTAMDELKAKHKQEIDKVTHDFREEIYKITDQRDALWSGVVDCGGDAAHYGLVQDIPDEAIVAIAYSTDLQLKSFIKKIGAMWNLRAGGFAMRAEHVEGITAKIKSKFPKCTITEERDPKTERILFHVSGDFCGYKCTLKHNKRKPLDDLTYIDHSTDDEFRAFTKSLGVKWHLPAGGYAIPAEHVENIAAQIQSKFPKWTITDERR